MLRALKALGLFNLNFYNSASAIGVRGKSIVEITISGGKKVIFFVFSNCHFIFMIFVEGNMVSAVA